jgi:hypothetical protein
MAVLLLPVIFVLLIVWVFIKKAKHEFIALKYNYKIYSLRDKLRMAVIDGKIKKSNWVFNYLDRSMSKLISNLSTLTIYSAMLLLIMHKNDKRITEVSNNIRKEVEKNVYLKEIFDEYSSIILEYLKEKHCREVWAAKSFLKILHKTIKIQKTVIELSKLSTLPETSVYALAK